VRHLEYNPLGITLRIDVLTSWKRVGEEYIHITHESQLGVSSKMLVKSRFDVCDLDVPADLESSSKSKRPIFEFSVASVVNTTPRNNNETPGAPLPQYLCPLP
jgi:hypothetical protein